MKNEHLRQNIRNRFIKKNNDYNKKIDNLNKLKQEKSALFSKENLKIDSDWFISFGCFLFILTVTLSFAFILNRLSLDLIVNSNNSYFIFKFLAHSILFSMLLSFILNVFITFGVHNRNNDPYRDSSEPREYPINIFGHLFYFTFKYLIIMGVIFIFSGYDGLKSYISISYYFLIFLVFFNFLDGIGYSIIYPLIYVFRRKKIAFKDLELEYEENINEINKDILSFFRSEMLNAEKQDYSQEFDAIVEKEQIHFSDIMVVVRMKTPSKK